MKMTNHTAEVDREEVGMEANSLSLNVSGRRITIK